MKAEEINSIATTLIEETLPNWKKDLHKDAHAAAAIMELARRLNNEPSQPTEPVVSASEFLIKMKGNDDFLDCERSEDMEYTEGQLITFAEAYAQQLHPQAKEISDDIANKVAKQWIHPDGTDRDYAVAKEAIKRYREQLRKRGDGVDLEKAGIEPPVTIVRHKITNRPTHIRDRGGILFSFKDITKWDGQQERFDKEIAEQESLAQQLLNYLTQRNQTEQSNKS